MFRWGGDDPVVELLDDDAQMPLAVTERDRSWWPVWIAAGVIAVIGLGAVATAEDSAGPAELAAPTSVPGPAVTTTTPTTTREATPSVSAAAISGPDQKVIDLGLTGYLFVWSTSSIHRLDLVSGEWLELPTKISNTYGFGTALVPTPSGIAAVSETFAISLTLDGEEIDTIIGHFSSMQAVAGADTVWVVDSPYSQTIVDIMRLDPSGKWIGGPTWDGDFGSYGMTLIPGGNTLYASMFSGGIFELTSTGTRRVADGYAVAANDQRMIRVNCSLSIETCGLEWLSLPDLAVGGQIFGPDSPQGLFDPSGWAPNLKYWMSRWDGGPIWETETGNELDVNIVSNGISMPSWSPDSQWVASIAAAEIRLAHVRSGEVSVIERPEGVNQESGRGPIMLYLP